MTDPSPDEIIALLSKQEEAVAALYSAFRDALPEMRSFWANLVGQEKAHAEVLRMVMAAGAPDRIRLDSRRFNRTALQTNIGYIEKQAARVASEGTTPRRALALAAAIENSLIERNYFRVIESDDPGITKELEGIERHTREHITLVETALRELQEAS